MIQMKSNEVKKTFNSLVFKINKQTKKKKQQEK